MKIAKFILSAKVNAAAIVDERGPDVANALHYPTFLLTFDAQDQNCHIQCEPGMVLSFLRPISPWTSYWQGNVAGWKQAMIRLCPFGEDGRPMPKGSRHQGSMDGWRRSEVGRRLEWDVESWTFLPNTLSPTQK